MKGYEVNFDGIVGLTHNYSGLSFGNVASTSHRNATSHPKAAALQGLEKMKFLSDMGIMQAVLPPQERPDTATLRTLGFSGSDEEVIHQACKQAPELFQACCSASSMWTANAATISPSSDNQDHRVHITPANLSGKFHRSIEPPTTSRILKKIFADEKYFVCHHPLPAGLYFSDEGAANHTRFCHHYHGAGVQLFVYGRNAFGTESAGPKKFPARQTFEASQAIARSHFTFPDRVVLAQQNPDAIDAGVFHNDVISVGNGNLLLYHEKAFAETPQIIAKLREQVQLICRTDLIAIPVAASDVSLSEAVSSYLFNSQIVTVANERMALIAPSECEANKRVHQILQQIKASDDNPIDSIVYINLRESMRNGGGPACLRLRVVLTEDEIGAIRSRVILTPSLYEELKEWINRHYRDRLHPQDLIDPALLQESRAALDELTKILQLGPIYPFQGKSTP